MCFFETLVARSSASRPWLWVLAQIERGGYVPALGMLIHDDGKQPCDR